MKRVIIVFADAKEKERAQSTCKMVRQQGGWNGDLIFLGIGKGLGKEGWMEKWQIQLVSRPMLDVSFLLEIRSKFPFESTWDGRETKKLIQFSKFWVFDKFFRQWDVILYLDAGMHVYRPIFPLFQLFQPGKLVALDDRFPFDDENKTFLRQFDSCIPDAFKEIEYWIRKTENYFLNCMWICCSSLIREETISDLLRLTRRFPISKTNEMAIMNLYFQKAWIPLPTEKNFFDWTQRGSKKPEDYILLKYPRPK